MRYSIARLTCIMLLALVVLVSVAGTINALGQTVPDDAQSQLLIAGNPASDGVQSVDDPGVMYALDDAEPVAISTSMGIPLYDPSSIPVTMPTMPAELMAYDPALAARVCDGISPAILSFPVVCAPNMPITSIPDMGMITGIGQYAAPMIPA